MSALINQRSRNFAGKDRNIPTEWKGYEYPSSKNPRKDVERNSPSLRDGISTKEETIVKEIASMYMGKLGMSLFISQYTIGIAHIFFHRFFSRQSLKEHSWQLVALTSVFLATKVEETPKKLDEIVMFHFKLEQQSAQVGSDTFKSIRNNVLHCERVLLHTLAFEIGVMPPQKHVLILGNAMKANAKGSQNTASALGNTTSSSNIDNDRKSRLSEFNSLMNHAISLINDTDKTTLTLQYPPHYIAIASLLLSDKIMSLKFKDSWKTKNPLSSLSDDLDPPSEENLNDICSQMMDIYQVPRDKTSADEAHLYGEGDGYRARKKRRKEID